MCIVICICMNKVVKLGYLRPDVNLILFNHIGSFTLKNLYRFYTDKNIGETDLVYYPVESMKESFFLGSRIKDISDCKIVPMKQEEINRYMLKSKMVDSSVPDIITKEEYIKEYKSIFPEIEQRLEFLLFNRKSGNYQFVLLADNRVLEKIENKYYYVITLKEKDFKELITFLYVYTTKDKKKEVKVSALELRGSRCLFVS